MKILLPKLKQFQSVVYERNQELFQDLARGQRPHTLMITCSDSRIDPNLVTQTVPGELFVIRNAGNIIPPYGACQSGEEASIEYAIAALKIDHIVVCGHSCCGAMGALMNPESTKKLPSVQRWLAHSEATRHCCEERQKNTGQPLSLDTVSEENVKTQINNLLTYPAVIAAIKNKQVNIFGWVYNIETGVVSILNPKTNQYMPSSELDEAAFDLEEYDLGAHSEFPAAAMQESADAPNTVSERSNAAAPAPDSPRLLIYKENGRTFFNANIQNEPSPPAVNAEVISKVNMLTGS